MRVLRPRGTHPAHAEHQDGQGGIEPRSRGRRGAPDDVRSTHEPGPSGGRRSTFLLRRTRLHTIVPRNVRLSEAPSFGMPIALYAPKSTGAEAYSAVADEVVNRG